MKTFHQQRYICPILVVVWSVSMLGCCCEAFGTTRQLSTSCSMVTRKTKTTITTTTTILPRACESAVGNTLGSSWWFRSAVDKDGIIFPSSHHPQHPLLLLPLHRIATRFSSWIRRPKWKRCLSTATLALYALFLHSPWVHASEEVEAVKVERIILEPHNVIPSTKEPPAQQPQDVSSAAVKPLTVLIGAGASAMAFRSVRKTRSTDRVSTNSTSPSRDSRTHTPLDDCESTTILEGQSTTMLLCPPPGGTESLLSAAQEEIMKDMATTTTTTTTTTMAKATKMSAGVLEHDPDIEQEIHDSLDIAKEWTFLHQPARNTAYPLRDPQFLEARRQPKSREEKERLAIKYATIDNVSERAFQVLLDLGMIEEGRPTVDMSKFEGIIDTTKKE